MLERHFRAWQETTRYPTVNGGFNRESQPKLFSYEWFAHLEARKDICAIFFDLQKAFDSVPHRAVMAKLHSLYPPLVMLIPDKQRTEGCHRGSIIRCSASYFWSPTGFGTWPVLTFSCVHRWCDEGELPHRQCRMQMVDCFKCPSRTNAILWPILIQTHWLNLLQLSKETIGPPIQKILQPCFPSVLEMYLTLRRIRLWAL